MRLGWISVHSWSWWKFMWRMPATICGLLSQPPSTVMPGRWGFNILGFEFGSRQPQDPFGVWLKNHHLWPW